MDHITMLGTGHAMTSECFNTCFVYTNEHGSMLVDTGGGQQLLTQLRKAAVSPADISCVFLTHRHTDHLLGLPWLLRMKLRHLATQPLEIITHSALCESAATLITLLFPEAAEHLGRNLRFTAVEDQQTMLILGRNVQFYDTHSDNVTQFGFVMTLPDGKHFVFNGDVPYHEANRDLMSGAKWLMHEAFCLERERKGPQRGHSSVAQAAAYARELNAGGLILVHGSDNDISGRKARYTEEAAASFHGTICVPEDLERMAL